MILKRKKCKFCIKLSLPGRAICWDHYRLRQKLLRDEAIARKQARAAKKTEKMHNSLSYLNDKAWPIFSRYIRFRDMDEDGLTACFTCGHRKDPRILQGGHYFHGRLDYDERNIHPQCVHCNKWNHGNLAVYGVKLTEELGADGMKQLMLDANTHRGYNTFELQTIIKEYGEKLQQIYANSSKLQ